MKITWSAWTWRSSVGAARAPQLFELPQGNDEVSGHLQFIGVQDRGLDYFDAPFDLTARRRVIIGSIARHFWQ